MEINVIYDGHFSGVKPQDVICKPSEKVTRASTRDIPKILTKGSLFIKNDLLTDTENGELLVVMAVDEIKMIVAKVLSLDLGSAYGALRVRSEDPSCFPSGLFIGGKLKPVFTVGEGLKPFLSILPELEIDVKAGITWLDDGSAEDESDYIQSFFFRGEMQFGFLGISTTSEIELQYFDDKEFIRRKRFNETVCCTEEKGATQCGTPNSALDSFISNTNVTPQPTIAMFMALNNMTFGGSKFVH